MASQSQGVFQNTLTDKTQKSNLEASQHSAQLASIFE